MTTKPLGPKSGSTNWIVIILTGLRLFCTFSSNLQAQDSSGSEDALVLAKRVCRIQMAYDELCSLREFVTQDSVGLFSEKGTIRSPIADRFLSAEVPVSVVVLPDSLAASFGFSLFRCYRSSAPHSRSYVLAIDRNGVFFLLHGFGSSDFNRLVKVKIREIRSPEIAGWVARMYLKTELYLPGGHVLVDSTISKILGRQGHKISLPTCNITKTGYEIWMSELVTHGEKGREIREHHFNIGREGKIAHSEHRYSLGR